MLRDPSGWKPKLDAEVIARVSGGEGRGATAPSPTGSTTCANDNRAKR